MNLLSKDVKQHLRMLQIDLKQKYLQILSILNYSFLSILQDKHTLESRIYQDLINFFVYFHTFFKFCLTCCWEHVSITFLFYLKITHTQQYEITSLSFMMITNCSNIRGHFQNKNSSWTDMSTSRQSVFSYDDALYVQEAANYDTALLLYLVLQLYFLKVFQYFFIMSLEWIS